MPNITNINIRRKKNVPDERYTIAVVKLIETLLRSDMIELMKI